MNKKQIRGHKLFSAAVKMPLGGWNMAKQVKWLPVMQASYISTSSSPDCSTFGLVPC